MAAYSMTNEMAFAKTAPEAFEQAECTKSPCTTLPDVDDESLCSDAESCTSSHTIEEEETEQEEAQPRQLQAGLFDEDLAHSQPSSASDSRSAPSGAPTSVAQAPPAPVPVPAPAPGKCEAAQNEKFEKEETFFIFDWDDTVLPSSWVQRQGLRLDEGSRVTPEQRELLATVAEVAAKTLRAARQHGTVILVTNAERGWIELSCRKFMPTLAPMLESIRMVSARTTYECAECRSPLDWKLRAFEAEIEKFFGADVAMDASKRKNVLSLGDSVHEREALLRAAAVLPNCHPKSLKFVERPDLSQICKQHELINSCFEQVVHHSGHLDMCIRCP